MQEIHPGILPVTLGTHIAYSIWLVLVDKNKKASIFSGHFTNCPSICEALTLFHLGLLTLTCFIIDYSVNTFVFSAIEVFIILADGRHMYH